jgi:hypothetical protein
VSEPTTPLADTYSLKGFVSVGAFADNVRGEIAPLGELSLQSATYSKDRAIYAVAADASNSTTLELSVFSSRTPANPTYGVPAAYQVLLLDIIKWCHKESMDGTLTNNAEACRQALMAQFDGLIVDAVSGPMIQQGTIWMPASLTFYIAHDALGAEWSPEEDADLERSRAKLWFADSAFSTEYDEHAIEFVAPIANDRLDDFFLLADQVETSVKARKLEELMILVHQAKDGNPETKIRTIEFEYHDPADPDWTLATNWTFVIYGIAGDNIDTIKEELSNWILDNSTHTREEWAAIFPDIFTSTEFIITPMWSQYAIPNETLQDGVYSPIVNVQNGLNIARESSTGTSYTQNHIDDVLAVVGCPFKSIALLVVGGPENREGHDRFEEVWADYIAVMTSSLDFNRMQPETQQWVQMLQAMLLTAETMTDFSDLPQAPYPMTRLRRTNAAGKTFMYVVCNFDNTQYLVASRQSVQQHFPPRGVDELRLTTEGAEGVTAMPNADTNDTTYSTTFVAVGGTQPYQYELVSVSDVNLLAGAAVDPDTGEFTADAIAGGDIQVTVKVTDDNGTVAIKAFTLHIYTGT